MSFSKLKVLQQKQQDGFIISAPALGTIYNLPQPGEVIGPGAYIGELQILSTKYLLQLGKNIYGKVSKVEFSEKIKAVTYAQPLFSLAPIDQANIQEHISGNKQIRSADKGKYVISAPSDGIFYRKPAPDAPCYVEQGSQISSGQVLALVEVMKCFNPITFTGAEFPEQAKIIEICAEDSSEVKFQQTLFVLE